MKRWTLFYLILICSLSLGGLGYGFMLSHKEVIEYVKNFNTDQQKAEYLLKRAKVFLDNERKEEAKNIAEYVLSNFDLRHMEAQEIIARTY
jgi:hypothetical protein